MEAIKLTGEMIGIEIQTLPPSCQSQGPSRTSLPRGFGLLGLQAMRDAQLVTFIGSGGDPHGLAD
jgi:hypothetical protein